MVLIAGVAIFAYVAGAIVELIAHGVLGGAWAERRRRRMIDAMRDHYIVCGYGRAGRRIAEELAPELRRIGEMFAPGEAVAS